MIFLNMKRILDEDVEILTAELLNCYLSEPYVPAFMKPQKEFTNNEAEMIKKHMLYVIENQTLSLPKMFVYSQIEIYDLIGGIYHLLDQLDQLKELLNKTDVDCKDRERANGYRVILRNIMDMDEVCVRLNNKTLRRRIQGMINVQKRYDGNLYQKREVIYRVLRESAKENGPWQTVTEAVNDVYPTLMKEFEVFDRQWIMNRINENISEIERLKKFLANNHKKSYENFDIKIQDRTYINQIADLEERNVKFTQALNAHNVADVLYKQLAFNSNDHEQTIINHVRNCPILLAEIIRNKVG